jgi:hypothetical protein
MAAAPAIAGPLAKRRAADGLERAPALDRGRVQQHQVVVVAGAGGSKDPGQPVDRLGQRPGALVVAGLAGDAGKQMPQARPGHGEKASVRRDAHDRLGDGQRDQLGVGDLAPSVGRGAGQEIVGGDIGRGAGGVEVGVHRDLRVSGETLTADFGSSARGPFSTARSVESIISPAGRPAGPSAGGAAAVRGSPA